MPFRLFDKLSSNGKQERSKSYPSADAAFLDLLGALSHFVRVEPLSGGSAESAVMRTIKRVRGES